MKSSQYKLYDEFFDFVHPAQIIKLSRNYPYVRRVNYDILVFSRTKISTKQAKLVAKKYYKKLDKVTV